MKNTQETDALTKLFSSEKSENTSWCKIADSFQTSALDAVKDHKFKHLVEIFKLTPDLIN
jgi:hypothetical protein